MQGAIAQVRPRTPRKRRVSPGLQEEARLAWLAGSRKCFRLCALRHPVPRLPLFCRCARLLVGGRFSPRHFADAPQCWAWAPPPPSVPGLESLRGWVRAGPWPLESWHPRAGNGVHCGHSHVGCPFWDPLTWSPPPTRGTKGRGASPRVTPPPAAHATSPHLGGGALLTQVREEWAAGTGECSQDGLSPTSCVEVRGGFSLPFMALGLVMAHDEGPSYSGQSVPVVLSL